jgi:peptidoglycan biosynthesis protein MviN/MurJ (putative lipid II flippase)
MPVAEPPAGAGRRVGGSTLVGAGILVSRATGLAREQTIGHLFGAGSAADAFTAP